MELNTNYSEVISKPKLNEIKTVEANSKIKRIWQKLKN